MAGILQINLVRWGKAVKRHYKISFILRRVAFNFFYFPDMGLKRGSEKNSMDQKKNKLLIVDDEEAILFAFSKTLAGPEVEIHTAQTLHDALKLLQENDYQAVIADLKLSGISNYDGYEVIKSAKRNQKECKIFVMTAFGDEKTKQAVFALGTDYYLEKPISPQKVKEILASFGMY